MAQMPDRHVQTSVSEYKAGGVLDHAFSSSLGGPDRGWCSSLARQQLYTDGGLHQVDLKCCRGHPGGFVAPECFWSYAFPLQDPRGEVTVLVQHCRWPSLAGMSNFAGQALDLGKQINPSTGEAEPPARSLPNGVG